jgi:CheY-like chemotaxis protein
VYLSSTRVEEALSLLASSTREEFELPKLDIAIVEDDESVCEATDHLLRLLGYVTASFGSAEDFLNSGRVRDTACLTDVRLPGMSGVELQSRLTLDGHCMPIIFVTAFPEETIRARVLTNGCPYRKSNPLAVDRESGDAAARC